MNLELLDPFRREIPDRIDSTLSIPHNLGHNVQEKAGNADLLLESGCLDLSFNRRGLYLAVGYDCGILAIFDFLSRTLVSHYQPLHNQILRKENQMQSHERTLGESSRERKKSQNLKSVKRAISFVSWSRRSRRLLCASMGDPHIYLIDNTFHVSHPKRSFPRFSSNQNSDETISNNNENKSSKTKNAKKKIAHSHAISNENSEITNMTQPCHTVKTKCFSKLIRKKPSLKVEYLQNSDHHSVFHWDVLKSSSEMRSIGERDISEKKQIHIFSNIVKTNEYVDTHPSKTEIKDTIDSYYGDQTLDGKAPIVQSLNLKLPVPIGAGGVQIHPLDARLGLAICEDGSVFLFQFPYYHFLNEEDTTQDKEMNTISLKSRESNELIEDKNLEITCKKKWNWEKAKIFPLVASKKLRMQIDLSQDVNSNDNEHVDTKNYIVTCASFNKTGNYVFAGTKCGHILCFDLNTSDESNQIDGKPPLSSSKNQCDLLPSNPDIQIKVSGSASITNLTISPNGHCLLLNSADGILRLYNIESILQGDRGQLSSSTHVPIITLQDHMSKKKYISPCFSGDSEYVIAGYNTAPKMAGERYELDIWSTASGALCDQLTGAEGVTLRKISCHPTRNFIAVSTSDGLVDIWGPRMDWTAFAPDFQAMTHNSEYIEMEDEFDIVVEDEIDNDNDNDNHNEYKNENLNLEKEKKRRKFDNPDSDEMSLVDVVTVKKVTVFESDSEDEQEIFWF